MAQIPKVCLNMIVKNESKIIIRLIESVIPYIDMYCICDTGSTDNTIELIKQRFAAANITGIIIQEPFLDFGHNRTFAINACEQLDADYILLLDADMIFKVGLSPEQFRVNLLRADAHHVFQGSDKFYYKNTRIVRNKRGFTYWGVTHEYVKTPPNTSYNTIDRAYVFINDIGDGGSKDDKYLRDVRLLTQGLVDNPNNDRYTFYLANSLRDSHQHEKAIEMYKKRIEIGGWIEEVWYSYYNIGKCYFSMKDLPNAIYYWLEGYNKFPDRIENLYEIIHQYRIENKSQLAYFYYELAKYSRDKKTSWDHLFLQKDVYDYKIDYELTIIGYYFNKNNYDLRAMSMKLLANNLVESVIGKNIISNYKFYCQELSKFAQPISSYNLTVLAHNNYRNMDFKDMTPSTPSVCFSELGELIVCRRYVNYAIDAKGGYVNKEHIITKNLISVIDISVSSWTLNRQFIMDYDKSLDARYVGLEDVRLFSFYDKPAKTHRILYNANRGLDQSIVVEHGKIDTASNITTSKILKYNKSQEIEKNWVLFSTSTGTKCVYNWSPLTIGTIDESGILSIIKEQQMPMFYKWVRGSTNGQQIDDEIWFINHVVSYEDRRYYYHLITVLDAETMVLKRYTSLFTFEKSAVEYTLGFVYFVVQNQLMIGYSVMDRETKYIMIDKKVFDDIMLPV